jgi:hypothetical protein
MNVPFVDLPARARLRLIQCLWYSAANSPNAGLGFPEASTTSGMPKVEIESTRCAVSPNISRCSEAIILKNEDLARP